MGDCSATGASNSCVGGSWCCPAKLLALSTNFKVMAPGIALRAVLMLRWFLERLRLGGAPRSVEGRLPNEKPAIDPRGVTLGLNAELQMLAKRPEP